MATRDSHAPSITSNPSSSQPTSPRTLIEHLPLPAFALSSPHPSAASDGSSYIVQLAQHLKDKADLLRPMGPTITVTLNEEGPIGVHIAQAGPHRVVILGTPPEFQAYKSGKVRFADQILRVGSNPTTGLKMKQVRALIADAFRPVEIKLQPLCFADEGTPIVPPPPSYFGFSPQVWSIISRAWALEPLGPPVRHQVPQADSVRWYRTETKVFVAVCPGKEELVGSVLLSLEGRLVAIMGDRELANLLVAKPIVEIEVQKYAATGAKPCIYCSARNWIESKYCHACGEPNV